MFISPWKAAFAREQISDEWRKMAGEKRKWMAEKRREWKTMEYEQIFRWLFSTTQKRVLDETQAEEEKILLLSKEKKDETETLDTLAGVLLSKPLSTILWLQYKYDGFILQILLLSLLFSSSCFSCSCYFYYIFSVNPFLSLRVLSLIIMIIIIINVGYKEKEMNRLIT